MTASGPLTPMSPPGSRAPGRQDAGRSVAGRMLAVLDAFDASHRSLSLTALARRAG
ncbi:hypothetical protein GA0115260_116893, partial [Streptomyces sp. MnatMP-M27]